ncbi:C-type lectin-like [Antedon mediterranea]|uniref:C-type lectin-like n=1 Tax=Antedon mediterranea TaxID=105859 RepID=UPI003AF4E4F6
MKIRITFTFLIIFMLVTSLVSSSTNGAVCPDLWQPFGRKCYRLFENPLNWFDSLEVCKGYQGSLATLNTEAKHNFIVEMCRGSCTQWIGFNDIDVEGVWKWASGAEDNDFNMWHPIEPNNGDGMWSEPYHSNADCARLDITQALWGDRNCVHGSYGFICEKEKHMRTSKQIYGRNGSPACLKESELADLTLRSSTTVRSRVDCFRLCISIEHCTVFQVRSASENALTCDVLLSEGGHAQYESGHVGCHMFIII